MIAEWYMTRGRRCTVQVHSVWYTVLVYGLRSTVYALRYTLHGTRFMVHSGTRYMLTWVCGFRYWGKPQR